MGGDGTSGVGVLHNVFLILMLMVTVAEAQITKPPLASQVRTDTGNFDGVLSTLDTTTQKALDTIDNIVEDGVIYDASGWRDTGTSVILDDSTDNVGIGTTIPAAKLEVDGNLYVGNKTTNNSLLKVFGADDASGKYGVLSADSAYGIGVLYGPYSIEGATVNSNGNITALDQAVRINAYGTGNLLAYQNVGINDSSPDFKLEVVDSLAVSSGTETNGDLFVVKSTGNAGVGSANPRYKLEVEGSLYAGSTNGFTEIQADGSLYAYGNATWYDDLFITLNPSTAVNAPTYTSWKGGRVITLSDEAVNEDQIPFTTQFTHAYKFGSSFDFHVHIVGEDTTTCNYRICVTYSIADINKAFPTQGTQCANIANLAVQDAHNYTHVADVVPDTSIYGNFVSTNVVGMFYRNSSNVLDTCNSKNLYFLNGDLHLERNTLGSRQETVK